MAKLCQITALLTGKKTSIQKTLTEIYHKFQKPALFNGLTKRYYPLDEEGETYPDEKQYYQQSVQECLDEMRESLTTLIDLVATQDNTNCIAKADVAVEDSIAPITILKQVPVTHLLFLEKQLTDLYTAVSALPTLDPQEKWNFDPNNACFMSEPSETNKTKKVPRTHVKYEATEHHPAQTEMYHEDVVVGRWKTTKSSTAIPATDKMKFLNKINKLRDAVKIAREEANTVEVHQVKYGQAIFNYVFGE